MLKSKTFTSAVVVLALLGLCAGAQAGYVETFDDSDYAFRYATVKNNGQVDYYQPTYHETGGNGGGFVSIDVNSGRQRAYTLEPTDIQSLGDITGMAMTVDTKLLYGHVDGAQAHPTVRFYIGSSEGGNNYFVSNQTFSWDVNNDTDWTRHMVELSAENFIEWPNQAAHSRTFAQVAANAQDIGLVFTDVPSKFNNNKYLGFSSLSCTAIGFDNFGIEMLPPDSHAVPAPGAVGLLTLGCVQCWLTRRKTNALS